MAIVYKKDFQNQKSVYKYYSRWIITSSISKIPSDGLPGEGSPFANSLIRVLLKNNNSQISTTKLFQKVKDEVKKITDNTPNIGILKNSTNYGGEFNFLLKKDFIGYELNQEIEKPIVLESFVINSMKKLEKEYIQKLEITKQNYEEKIKEIEKKQIIQEKELDKKKLIQLLRNDKIIKYFEEIQLIEESLDENTLTNLILFENRWRAIENRNLLGTISLENEHLEKNKIRVGLIQVTTKIKAVTNKG